MHRVVQALAIADDQGVGLHAALDSANAHKQLQVAMPSTENSKGFFALPAEIRYMVYEQCLLVRNVRIQTINPIFDDKLGFYAPDAYHQPPPGTLQGVSLWNVEYKLERAILAVNKEVYREAISIYKLNDWIRISVNVDGFSAELKRAGFKILTPRHANDFRIPPLALEVEVAYDLRTLGRDNFFCSSVDLPGLCRALSLTTDYDNAKLTLTMGTCRADVTVQHQDAREWELIGPFTKPFGKPGRLEVFNIKSTRIKEWFLNFDGTAWVPDVEVKKVISDKLDESNRALQEESWQVAHDKALSCLGLIDVINKYDTARLYIGLLSFLICRSGECLSNMTLARLKLEDSEGAEKKSQQITLGTFSDSSLSHARLRQAVVCIERKKNSDSLRHFTCAYNYAPSNPQLRKELEVFEKRLLHDAGGAGNLQPHTVENIVALRDVRRLLGGCNAAGDSSGFVWESAQ